VSRLVSSRGVGGVLIFLLLWEMAIRSGVFRFEYLPPPSAIAMAFGKLVMTAAVFEETAHTVCAALIAWAIAATIGVVFGGALGLSPVLRAYTMTSVEVLRALPPVALIPVALLLFGFSIQTELVVIAVPGIWPVLIGTMGGVMAAPTRLRDVAESMRFGQAEVFCKILIPGAAPSVLVGCRLSMTISLVLAIVVEMIGNPQGLGYAVVREAMALDRETMFAYVFLIGLLGVFFNGILVAASKMLLPGEFGRPNAVMRA
jgi:ABC-type nitrate/sulfonate/bicarbonate transport system permease component